ncbi:hypothetical protein ZIOFF_037954 [Zingiber officinale]|uniref:Uncharacterized protein n=1 Tax=Zingiber officinale TaxID=94328 RepID=A0A8J5GKR0_ZINOF|nr:hypothetical protein ZIOFF_037954 [Zingiber officinale]
MVEGDDEILGARVVDFSIDLRSIEEDFAMDLSLFSWIWGRKQREVPKLNPGNSSSSSSAAAAAAAAVDASGKRLDTSRSPSGETWRARRRRRTDPRVDKEHDAVIVPPDGGCVSCSDSDEEDWAVGWLEPHGPDFRSSEDSFAVLVPCYDRAPGNDDRLPGELLARVDFCRQTT